MKENDYKINPEENSIQTNAASALLWCPRCRDADAADEEVIIWLRRSGWNGSGPAPSAGLVNAHLSARRTRRK